MFVTSVVAAFVALPFVAQSALANSCTRTYTIQQGDWCDTISAAHNSSTYQLAVVNIDKIDSECSNLIPGDQLCLGTEGQDCTQTYVVKPGDICEDVANNHRINATVFYQNNPQLNADCDNLYDGEVVCVASTVLVPNLPEGSPMPATTIPAGVAPARTLAPSSSSPAAVSTPTPTPAPADNDDDEDCDDDDNDDDVDEDDLPFCDELE
ncbi:hypothetical protein NLI96_g5750 [Meripilus lineatus]|uniref:LysM domain-containing protein n=1 Tax=Meripilus lineatus TaxID=2056292 RepID=A0AAD5YGM8_9APHY|nr:hypothetical protein NLI96_g5750 [Physisporinus lineatus]